MLKKSLKELLEDLEQELLRLGYTEGSMKFYHNRWSKILKFAEDRNEIYYSEQLEIDFIESHYRIFEKDFGKTLSQKDTQELRIIRMIGDFQLHHTVLRRFYKHRKLLADLYYINISNNFKKYCELKEYSKVTVDHYVKQSERFMDYLLSQGIRDCHDIKLPVINGYIRTLAGYTYKTVEQVICSIRSFLKYLQEQEVLKTDLASKTPMVQARKQTRIPSVWTKEELDTLIGAVDRGSPKGKRDYAMILLACVLGLRVTDIKNLTFGCFHWEEKKLIFTQSKTRETVTLPIPAEVGWAVIDYLKYGRPKVESQIVFVRHELQRFFHETDQCHYVSECPYRHLIMPLFFRMVYACGLRSSEARLLKVADVDIEAGILTIQHSKKDNSRLVPMSDELTERCRNYSANVHMFSKETDWFFPGLNGKPMTVGNVYHNFRRFLWRTGISHGGRGKGPRVHDLRHAHACHCLKKWVLQGKDLAAYLPVLKTYMGHDSFEETAYYLRLTADVFPDISVKLEGCYLDIIPGLEGGIDETD